MDFPDPTLQVNPHAYGFGQGADQYGRPVQPVVRGFVAGPGDGSGGPGDRSFFHETAEDRHGATIQRFLTNAFQHEEDHLLSLGPSRRGRSSRGCLRNR